MANEKKKIYFLSRVEFFLVISFFVFVFGSLIFIFFTPNYYKHAEPVVIDIPHGATLSTVIDSLYIHEIIQNRTNMKIVAYIYGAEKKIKAGRYKIPNGLSYIKLVDMLVNGATAREIIVTIPEGIFQSEVAQILKRDLNIDSSKVIELSKSRSFINSLGLNVDNLEGYLLPETYYFDANATAEEVLRRLKAHMDKIFTPAVEEQMNELGMTKHQILTLASIVDGESNYVPEFKTIAGVYYNRLKRGMLLQADPTIQYLVRDKHKNRILLKDLLIKSKYNTYMHAGLPPGPINNPGKDAIMAALYPERNNYLYFVANGNGNHIFAKTLNEHNINVSHYRQWRKSQN